MNTFSVFAAFMLVAVVVAELPSGGYGRGPSGNGGNAASNFGGGGNYQQESIGQQTSEGLQVDQQLLEQIKQILLKEESQSSGNAGGGNGGPSGSYGAPQQQYGAPQQQYGAPSGSSARVVGIDIENAIQAIQVAQYSQQGGSSAGGNAGGYSRGPQQQAPSQQYGSPQQQQQQQRPSSNYGAPF